ncbi:WXG100 family type VII secretion target [Streptomyces sp. NPDC048506]|uniref:WXG100 family type VII secretion target n=1 Tax=Streptomyces sp. NPDC048506 TaxID=3155028 RepID=UPI003439A6BB
MENQLKVHFASLVEASEALESIAKNLQEELTTLDDAVKSIAEAWTGDAHISFRSYYDQWRSKSANLHRDLRNLQKITHTAHGNYSAAQVANLKMWGRA